MITDDAMEVHFGLRLLDRAADHAYCHNYPGANQTRKHPLMLGRSFGLVCIA